eukprot:gene7928-9315_t
MGKYGSKREKYVNTESHEPLLGGSVNREDEEAKIVDQTTRTRLIIVRVVSVVLIVAYLAATNALFFAGSRVIFLPNSSVTPVSALDSFSFKYFFEYSTFDVLLLSYLQSAFWVVTLVTDGFHYHLVSLIVTLLGLVYLVVKAPLALMALTSDDQKNLPAGSPMAVLWRREMAEAMIITAMALCLLFIAASVYPLLQSHAVHKKLAKKTKDALEAAERQDSSVNKNIPDSTEVKHSNMGRLAKLSRPELPLVLGGMIGLLFSSFSSLAIPAFFGEIVQVVSTSKSINALNNSVISLVVVFAIGSLATFVRSYLFYLAGQKFVARVRKELFHSIVKQDVAFFDQSRTGELVNRLASDTEVIQDTVIINVSMGIRYIIQIIGCIVLLFITNWRLTLVMLGTIPVLIVGTIFYGKKVKLLGKRFQNELAKSSSTGEEVISNIRTVKAFSKEEKFVNIYAKDIHKSYLIGKTLALVSGVFSGVVSLIAQLAIILIVYIGAKQVLQGQITTGQLTGFLLYTLTLAMSLGFVSSLLTDFMKAVGASDRIFELMDRVPAIPIDGGIKLDHEPNGEIELHNLDFTYAARPNSQVLNGINIKLTRGTITALVGPSGGGKSTIVSLIERFYDPNNGHITFDGVDIRTLDPRWYRSLLGFVSQEPLLFSGTIRENISFGVDDASMADVIDAAEKANAHSFISQFEAGYDTVVGERGVRLSGGQKQRVAIARALLLNPVVLLLDEATSALDAESEYLVKEAIDRLMHNRTVLVIAHRLSTVVNANSVLVISGGTIQQSGTHQQLIQDEDGIYYNLVKRQLSKT